jgi:hypothetical protein
MDSTRVPRKANYSRQLRSKELGGEERPTRSRLTLRQRSPLPKFLMSSHCNVEGSYRNLHSKLLVVSTVFRRFTIWYTTCASTYASHTAVATQRKIFTQSPSRYHLALQAPRPARVTPLSINHKETPVMESSCQRSKRRNVCSFSGSITMV